jgi:hypothetical protein
MGFGLKTALREDLIVLKCDPLKRRRIFAFVTIRGLAASILLNRKRPVRRLQ